MQAREALVLQEARIAHPAREQIATSAEVILLKPQPLAATGARGVADEEREQRPGARDDSQVDDHVPRIAELLVGRLRPRDQRRLGGVRVQDGEVEDEGRPLQVDGQALGAELAVDLMERWCAAALGAVLEVCGAVEGVELLLRLEAGFVQLVVELETKFWWEVEEACCWSLIVCSCR